MNKSLDRTDHHVGSRVRMRRLMLDMSQTTLAGALGISFQQVQKYEKGKDRISASRLQQIASILQVPVSFFFEGQSNLRGIAKNKSAQSVPDYVSAYLASSDGLALTRAFMDIKDRKVRRRIVQLVEGIAENGR